MPIERINDLDIHVQTLGDGPPLLMLHGFTGSIEAWQGIPAVLGRRFQTSAVDIIGHGESSAPETPERYSIPHAVTDLLALLDTLGIERCAVLGYSMGGRVALHLALAAPERITALVLESASPGIDDPVERESRIESDERQARMIEEQGLAAFIDHWESIPLFASQRSLPEEVRQRQRELRMSQNPVGLANSLRGMGAGVMEPVSGRLDEFQMPVLYLAGEFDGKYREIGEKMAEIMPDARYIEIPGAGHTIHLERPDVYAETVRGFLASHALTDRSKGTVSK